MPQITPNMTPPPVAPNMAPPSPAFSNPAPMPPTPMSQMTPPVMRPPQPASGPAPAPAPIAPQPMVPQPVAPQPVAPQPVAPQPVAQVAQVAATVAAPAVEAFTLATVGDLFNNGAPVAVLVTDSQIRVLTPGGAPMVENVPGLRHAVIGDFDGDGTQEMAVFSDSQVWVLRFSQFGSVPSGKVTLKEMPEHLTKAPFTYDGGRTVLMSATTEKITFYVLHPSKGLVEIASTTVPPIEH